MGSVLLEAVWRKVFFATALLFFASLLLSTNSAHAGIYTVRDCKPLSSYVRTNLDAGQEYIANPGGLQWSLPQDRCPGAGVSIPNYLAPGRSIWATNGPFVQDDVAKIRYTAPLGSGYTSLGFAPQSTFSSGTEAHSRVIMHDQGVNPIIVQSGAISQQYINYSIPGNGMRQQWEMNVKCMNATCSPGGWFILNDIVMGINDYTNPNVGRSGSLFAVGPKSGIRTVDAWATDGQSGVWFLQLFVNGQSHSVAAATSSPTWDPDNNCNPWSPKEDSVKPCPNMFLQSWNVDTRVAPFQQGVNEVKVCAFDYTGNQVCSPTEHALVLN